MPYAKNIFFESMQGTDPAVTEAITRFAGETPLPEEMDAVRRLLLQGAISDDTGTIQLSPNGGIKATTKDGYILEANFGRDPRVEIGFEKRF